MLEEPSSRSQGKPVRTHRTVRERTELSEGCTGGGADGKRGEGKEGARHGGNRSSYNEVGLRGMGAPSLVPAPSLAFLSGHTPCQQDTFPAPISFSFPPQPPPYPSPLPLFLFQGRSYTLPSSRGEAIHMDPPPIHSSDALLMGADIRLHLNRCARARPGQQRTAGMYVHPGVIHKTTGIPVL